MKGPAIDLTKMSLSYASQTVIETMDHHFAQGQCHMVMGPNGGGKTSLLRSIMGLTPFDGQIEIHWPEGARQRMGYVPQKALFESSLPISVLDFMLLNMSRIPLFLQWLSPQRHLAKRKVLLNLERVGMAQRAHLRLGQLSGGELQRVLFAQALLDEPELLILDEPTTGMDEQGVQYLEQLIVQLVNQGVTVLAVHHDIHAVKRILNQTQGVVHVINRGLVDSGSVSDVLHPDKIEHLFLHYSKHAKLNPKVAA